MTTLRIGKLYRQIGFSLIEVLICVVVLSIGLVVINQTLLRSVGVVKYSSARFQADYVTQNKVWEIQSQALHDRARPPMREDGVLLGLDQTFPYELRSVPVKGSDSLYEVRITIQWHESGKKNKMLRTFYARLPPSPPKV